MIPYSIEILYHFRCPTCSSWWPVSDFNNNPKDEVCVSCPTCGHKDTIEVVKNKESLTFGKPIREIKDV